MLSIDELFLACDAGIGRTDVGQTARQANRRPTTAAPGRAAGRRPLERGSARATAEIQRRHARDADRRCDADSRRRDAPRGRPALAPRHRSSNSPPASSLQRAGAPELAPAHRFRHRLRRPGPELTFTGTISPTTAHSTWPSKSAASKSLPNSSPRFPARCPRNFTASNSMPAPTRTIHLARHAPAAARSTGRPTSRSPAAASATSCCRSRSPSSTAKIGPTPTKLVVKQLTGKVGAADFVLACNRQGWAANAPLGLAGRISGLAVNADLQAALPARLEQLWQRFRPQWNRRRRSASSPSTVSEWRPELTAHCRGLSLTDAEKFPYPIDRRHRHRLAHSFASHRRDAARPRPGGHGGRPADSHRGQARSPRRAEDSGRCRRRRGRVAFGDVAGRAERRPARERHQRRSASRRSRPAGSKSPARGVSIHEQLLAALPAEGPTVCSLAPAARAHRFSLALRAARSRRPARRHVARPQARRLCDPVRAVPLSARANSRPRHRPQQPLHAFRPGRPRPPRFGRRHLPGRSGSHRRGPRPRAGVPRHERAARRQPQASALAAGAAGLDRPPPARPRQFRRPRPAAARPGRSRRFASTSSRTNRSVSVEPVFFPYRFEQVDGRAIVTDGRVDLQQLQGHPRPLAVHRRRASGRRHRTAAGSSMLERPQRRSPGVRARLPARRAARRAESDRPHSARPAISMSTTRRSASSAGPRSPQVASQWDMQLACHQAALRGDLPLENLTGGIRLMGTSDGTERQSPTASWPSTR